MAKRIFSSTLLWAIVVAALWFLRANGVVLLAVLMSALTLREFYRLMRGCGHAPFDRLGITLGAIITLSPWLEAQPWFLWPAAPWLALATVVFSVRLLGERTAETRVDSLGATLFGLVYVSCMLSYFVRIAVPLPADTITPDGRLLLCLWLIATAKFADMGGYLAGLAIGRHKMSPQISPKKTWEGFAGGVLASMGIAALLAHLMRSQLPPHLTPLFAALIALPIALLSVVGDLVESVIKRRANLKDSGQVLPGQGGYFDISDSLILVAPVGYLLFRLP
jgi:phosphatidate cytidylyltransferase